MNHNEDSIKGVKLFNKDVCDDSHEDSKSYGDVGLNHGGVVSINPRNEVTLEEGDCISTVGVIWNMDAIERLSLFTMNGKVHRIGKNQTDMDIDDLKYFHFGNNSCLVGISFGASDTHVAHGVKFWY